MKVAFDMSSVMWTCLSAGIDTEGEKVEFEGKLVQVNKAAYGYENAVNHMVGVLNMWGLTPKDVIMVFEGLNSKARRLAISPQYKAKRGRRPAEAYDQFHLLQSQLKSVFGSLGALSITQDNAEGDDTLGWLAYNTREDLVIASGDNDISVLNGKNAFGATVTVTIKGVSGGNTYGDWPTRYITVYKAMVGDSRDNIIGIKGFGPVMWDGFMQEFGKAGLREMARLGELGTLEPIHGEVAQSKMIERIVLGEQDYLTSYNLAKIHPEWVNTFDYPIKWEPGLVKGKVNDERLAHWCEQTRLVTAETWEKFKTWARPLLLSSEYVALDIETSTPEISDEWLAAQGKEDGAGVDVMGSELTGMSLTFGKNLQYTVYISVDHADTANVEKESLRDFIKELTDAGTELIIQNFSFEGTVLYNEWGKHWKDNGYNGLLPKCLDTKLEASYVNENESLGLKKLSKMYFNYDQVDYKTVTTIDGVQYKMNQLRATHVKDYGCDDTIVTASLHNFFKLFMQLEGTWDVYKAVEIDAMYLHTQSFIHGTKVDVAKVKELEAIDKETHRKASEVLNAYLVSKGWAGTVPPTYTEEPTPAQIKDAFAIVTGSTLESRNRKYEKLCDDVEAVYGGKLLAELLRKRDWTELTAYVQARFKGAPEFNSGSPKQMQNLLYETMGLPVRVYNKPTPVMRKQGIRQGSPKTDTLAIQYALNLDATEEQKGVLEALRLMKMVETREGLYYSTYPYFVHWKTGRVHSSHNQCSTNTRRASSSAPNTQQLPKHTKLEGQPARFREVYVPHKRNAVIVSMDFSSQEILLLAEWSKDPELEQVFIGDPPKDMHSMTGVGIFNSKQDGVEFSYEEFKAAIDDQQHPSHKICKKYRSLGKAINFSGQYRASAMKMATMLFVTEDEAQAMIDAKAAAFPVSEQWAIDEMAAVKETGIVRSMLGAVRHLRDALLSDDYATASKAERQTLSYRIQGSAAEMTKLAEGRMWSERLEQRFDCQIIGPIHDEVVASCAIDDLHEFIPAMHACMVANYANMKLPIRSSISFGPNFGEQIEIGSEPTKEAVDFGLAELAKLTA